MTSSVVINKNIDQRLAEFKARVLEEDLRSEHIMIGASMSDGVLHVEDIPIFPFFNLVTEGFNYEYWSEQIVEFLSSPVPYLVALSIPMTIQVLDLNGNLTSTSCIGIACIHRFFSRTGGYIQVGDEYMWEKDFNIEFLLPFIQPVRRHLAQRG